MANLFNQSELALQRGINHELESAAISPLAKDLVEFRNKYIRRQLDIGSVRESYTAENRYFRVDIEGHLTAVVIEEAKRNEEQDELVQTVLEEANAFIDQMENMDSGLAKVLGVDGFMNLLKTADENERAKLLFFIRTAVNSARPKQNE